MCCELFRDLRTVLSTNFDRYNTVREAGVPPQHGPTYFKVTEGPDTYAVFGKMSAISAQRTLAGAALSRVEALALRAHGVLGILCRSYAGLEHTEAG